MTNEDVDEIVTCPSCGRVGRLKGTLAISRASGTWLSFVPEAVPRGFTLVTNARIRLICACGSAAWPAGGQG